MGFLAQTNQEEVVKHFTLFSITFLKDYEKYKAYIKHPRNSHFPDKFLTDRETDMHTDIQTDRL